MQSFVLFCAWDQLGNFARGYVEIDAHSDGGRQTIGKTTVASWKLKGQFKALSALRRGAGSNYSHACRRRQCVASFAREVTTNQTPFRRTFVGFEMSGRVI
jgi:hypothetical protein